MTKKEPTSTDSKQIKTQLVIPELLDAYGSTLIEVKLPAFTWSVDPREEGVAPPAELAPEAWVITACNPRSQVLSEAENQVRNRELRQLLEARGVRIFEAEGRSVDGSWREASFAVVGLKASEIEALAMHFDQNAVFRISDLGVEVVITASRRP
jgi:hypothetical protein